ncbi:thymidylate kinase [Streptomyces lunaelactis]|uniref:Thymidylate kinase n=1 Tax=Streptomyces lunaelactis TaxID=1535768 RepID=A0A2R4T276_9ACTN|nr:AAA family ATPase [Streptomyces lunaelactis]AVZ73157.1 thymidylate kinase [Streptomyces lunaelactis]NUK85336.1 AAA family ATPase [Streptomyces lunaelactis]
MISHPYLPVDCDGPRSPFVVLEGVSGIGKSTLAATLAKRLQATELHTLPMPHSGWSSTANRWLRPLPQFAFYLSGVLHAADSIRQSRMIGTVVADRYISSVIACHAAVHGLQTEAVTELVEPFRPYLEVPTHTFYLRCSESVLRERMAGKPDTKQDDTDLFAVPGRLAQLLANFEAVGAADSTAVVVDTDAKTPDDLAEWVIAHLEGKGA